MELIAVFRTRWRQFGDVSHSARFKPQFLRSMVAVLALSTLPGNAVRDSFEMIQAGRGEQRPAENGAVTTD